MNGRGLLRWAAVAGVASACGAAQPGWIRYQGRLIENGVLANRPNIQITFYLYDQPSGGTLLYQEADTVTASEGFYATDLGDKPDAGSPNPEFARALATAGTNAWLALRVDAGPELQPRERLGGAPFAVNSADLRRVLTVGPGGEYATINAALDAIGGTSASNAYLVKVGPGVYAEQIKMKSFVDIEGCGRGVTTISFVSTNGLTPDFAVYGASTSELRHLSIAAQGALVTTHGYWANNRRGAALSDVAITVGLPATTSGSGVLVENMSGIELRDVDITVTGGSNANTYGVSLATGSSGKIRDTRITLSGAHYSAGIQNSESAADLEDVGIAISGAASAYGMSTSQGGIEARDVEMTVSGGSPVLGCFGSEGSLSLRDVKAMVVATGICIGVSASWTPVTMASCSFEAVGAANVLGLNLFESDGNLLATRVTARGGTPTQGVDAQRPCTLNWNGGRLDVAGAAGATNIGLRCVNNAFVDLHSVAIRLTSGGAAADGLLLETTGSARTNRIHQCILSSPGNAVRANGALYTTFLGGSLLQGGLLRSAGVLRTVHCYDEACAAIADGDH